MKDICFSKLLKSLFFVLAIILVMGFSSVAHAYKTLTIKSDKPGNGVVISYSGSTYGDASGTVTTPGSKKTGNNDTITLVAPAIAPNGNIFESWSENSVVKTTSLTVIIPMNGSNQTYLARYKPPTTTTSTTTTTTSTISTTSTTTTTTTTTTGTGTSTTTTTSTSTTTTTVGVRKISGYVYKDGNCNHVKNVGEPGIAGVTLTLTGPAPAPQTTTTNSSGYYKFTGLKKKTTYTVTETDPAGYCSTTPNVKTVYINTTDVSSVNFGDFQMVVSPPGGCCY